jgi:hypothetical protein
LKPSVKIGIVIIALGLIVAVVGPSTRKVEYEEMVTMETVWEVEWKKLEVSQAWTFVTYSLTDIVGNSTFPAEFCYDWGLDAPFSNYSDYIGFYAKAEVYAPRDMNASFKVGGDDGFQLAIDGDLIIDAWNNVGGYSEKTAIVKLSKGKHMLELSYFDLTGPAKVCFDTDDELLTYVGPVIRYRVEEDHTFHILGGVISLGGIAIMIMGLLRKRTGMT